MIATEYRTQGAEPPCILASDICGKGKGAARKSLLGPNIRLGAASRSIASTSTATSLFHGKWSPREQGEERASQTNGRGDLRTHLHPLLWSAEEPYLSLTF